MKNLLLLIFLSSLWCAPIIGQNQELEITDLTTKIASYDKVFEVTIGNPNFSIHYPTGVIFRDSSYDNMSMLNERSFVLSDGPFGFQFTPTPPNYYLADNNSSEYVKQLVLALGGNLSFIPIRTGYWGQRDQFSFSYDFETYGDVSAIDFSGRKMSVLTQQGAVGRVDVYDYTNVGPGIPALRGSLGWNGGIFGLTVVSDRSLKDNIRPMRNVLPSVLKLQPQTYNYIGRDALSEGFIAQEVQKVFPQLVQDMDGRLGVNYLGFTTIAIQAIKEQQEIIQSLSSKVEALEEKLDRILQQE